MQVFSKRVIHIRLYNILCRYKWSAQFYNLNSHRVGNTKY